MNGCVETWWRGGVDDDPTAIGVLATVSEERALEVARAELEGADYGGVDKYRDTRFDLRVKGKELYRVTTEVEDRIEGYEEGGQYKRCTPRAKSGREFWVVEIIWLTANQNPSNEEQS